MPTEATTTVTVEFEDVDVLGIAHHAAIVTYLERARMRLVTAAGLRVDEGPLPVVHELHVRFQRPLRLFDRVEVAVWVAEADDFVLRLDYRLRRAGRSVATATTTIAFADRLAGSLVPAPPGLAARLESR